jgi:rSAM/selenodomain-associated transferase 1
MGLEAVCAIAVMAKAPQPGQVKTRLQSVLQPAEAAALSAAFLRDATANIQAAAAHAPVHGFVAYAPTGAESRFDGLLAPGTELVLADGADGDADGVEGFGRCLLHASRALLARGYGAACLLNADSPTLPTALLVQAARHLLAPGRCAVLGPADDGGYWLLGMQSAESALYARIAWSTGAVAAATARRAEEIGLRLHTLASWFDVDDRASLERLVRGLAEPTGGPNQPFSAPATAACVAALRLQERLRSALSDA